MRATLIIKLDNAAFDETAPELARILACLADQIARNGICRGDTFPCVDYNGSKVGELKISRRKRKV